MRAMTSHAIRLATVLGLILAIVATSAQAQVILKREDVTVVKPAPADSNKIDFLNAKPFPLPGAPESASVTAQQDLINNLVNRCQSAPAASGHALGSEGDGQTHPVELGAPAVAPETIEQQQ